MVEPKENKVQEEEKRGGGRGQVQRMYNFKAFFAVLKSVKEVRRLER